MPPRPVAQCSNRQLTAELDDHSITKERRGEILREIQRRQTQSINSRFASGELTALRVLQIVIREVGHLASDQLPISLTGCRNWLRTNRVHINIYDFLEFHQRKGGELFTCETVDALRKRCGRKGFYPLAEAKHSELKKLLEVMFHRGSH